MPPVISAVKVAWAALGKHAIGKFIQSVIVSFAIGKVMEAIAGKPKAPTLDESLKMNNTSNVSALPVVYGRRLVGGSEYRAVTGTGNKYLHRVMTLSEGEIDSVEKVFVNDKDVSIAPYASKIITRIFTGASNQIADAPLSFLLSEWNSSFVGENVAYLIARLEFDTDVFNAGLPVLTALVKGKKVYDPRLDTLQTGGSGSHRSADPDTWEWSENPALCVLDYMTSDIFGRNIPYSDIDIDSFMVEADYCDETITLISANGDSLPNQKRYTCNGVVDTQKDSLEIIKELLSSCRGTLVAPSDKFRIVIDKPTNSVFQFTEDNLVGAWSIVGGGVRDRKNRVQTRFFDKNNNYDVAIKLVTSSGSTNFLTEDNNRVLQAEISLPFTDEHIRADILSQHFLKQSRLPFKVSFKANIEALAVEAMDLITIKHAFVGWDSGALSNGKLFRVIQVSMTDTETVMIQAEQYDPSVYTFDVNTPPQSPNTNLPDPNSALPPSSLTLDSSELQINKDGTIVERIRATWGEPTLAFVHHYEIAWKATGDSGFTIVATDDNDFYISPVNSTNLASNGVYYVKVRAVYNQGQRSSWFPSDGGESHVVVGKSAPPNKPLSFTFSVEADYTRRFDWTSPSDADIRGYQIRYSEVLSDLWDDMTNLHEGFLTSSPFETSLLSSGTYRFAIKSLDTSGNVSTDAQYITATLIDNPSVEILASQYPRLEGWKEVGFTGNGDVLRKKITAIIPFNGTNNTIDFYYSNKEITEDYWVGTSDESSFGLYISDTTHSAYGNSNVQWRLARYTDSGSSVDEWRVFAIDATGSNVYTTVSGSDGWTATLSGSDRFRPLLGTYSASSGNAQTGNITLTTAYDFTTAGTQTGTGTGTVEITYTIQPYDSYEIQHSTDGFTTIDTIETGVRGSLTTTLVRDHNSTTYTGSFRVVGYHTNGNYVDFPETNGGEISKSSGDLDSYASPSAEWVDLNTDTWDDWTSFGFASETLQYETFGFEFGIGLSFRPVVQVVGNGTITSQVSIVPSTVNGLSDFAPSDYSSFFTPSGSVSAKAMKVRIVAVGVNAGLKSASILLDGKQLSEELLNLDTSTLDSNYRISAGHIYLPLQKTYTNVSTIQISLIGTGGNHSAEIVSKTTTVGGRLAPEIKIHHSGSTADAVIDAIIKGF